MNNKTSQHLYLQLADADTTTMVDGKPESEEFSATSTSTSERMVTTRTPSKH